MSVNGLPMAAFTEDTTNDTLLETLRESGHLIERGAPQEQLTPVSNTGLDCQDLSSRDGQQATNQHLSQSYGPCNPDRFSARCHWLQGTFTYYEGIALKILGARLEKIFNDTFEWDCGPFTSGKKYDDSARSANGMIMAWQCPDKDKPGRAWLCIPGSALDRLLVDDGEVMLVILFHLLETGCLPTGERLISGWTCTRLDTAVDDFEKVVRPKDLQQYAEVGDYAGFRFKPKFDERTKKWLPLSWKFTESGACDSGGNLIKSGTLTFGSAQSDKTLNIYDKYIESNGVIDSVRWEARWRDEYAQVRFKKICEYLFEPVGANIGIGNVIAAITMGAIDFIDRSSADRASRCARPGFWSDMLEALKCIKIPLSAAETYLEKTTNWLLHQGATFLSVIEQVCGLEDLLTGLYMIRENGSTRIRKNHVAMIEQGKKDKFDFIKCLSLLISKYSDSSDACEFSTG